VGFGISSASQAAEIASKADGVIVGSAIIDIIEKYGSNGRKLLPEIKKFASGISSAVH
jgi:tryptophan synthase alpha chain